MVRRETGTIESRLIEVINQLSPIDIMEATGKTTDYFYKCSNINNRQSLHFRDAINLDSKLVEIGKQPEFFNIYQEIMNETSTGATPDDCFMQLIREIGELATVLKSDAPREVKIKEAQDVFDHASFTLKAIKEQG